MLHLVLIYGGAENAVEIGTNRKPACDFLLVITGSALALHCSKAHAKINRTRCSAIIEDWNWETIFYGQYRSIFNHCDIIGRKICRIP